MAVQVGRTVGGDRPASYGGLAWELWEGQGKLSLGQEGAEQCVGQGTSLGCSQPTVTEQTVLRPAEASMISSGVTPMVLVAWLGSGSGLCADAGRFGGGGAGALCAGGWRSPISRDAEAWTRCQLPSALSRAASVQVLGVFLILAVWWCQGSPEQQRSRVCLRVAGKYEHGAGCREAALVPALRSPCWCCLPALGREPAMGNVGSPAPSL